MNKIIISLVAGLFLVAVSCALITDPNRQPPSSPDRGEPIVGEQSELNQTNPNTDNTDGKIETDNPTPDTPKENSPRISLSGYDTKELDAKVIEQAKSLNVDPKTYRMPFRADPDGTIIYRMLGMFVIVNPDDTEVFLPDSLSL